MRFIFVFVVGCTSADRSVDLGRPDDVDASSHDAASPDLVSRDLASADLASRDFASVEMASRDFASVDLGGRVGGDGVCTPGSPASGVFDPDCVYLIGTLLPGAAGNDVIVHTSAPTDYSWGFPYNTTNGGTIRPGDGRFVYASTTAYVWAPDSPPVGNAMMDVFLSNDTVIASPGCPLGVYATLVFPDDGAVAMRCFHQDPEPASDSNRLFLEAATTPIIEGGTQEPLAVGPGRSALLVDATTMTVVSGGTRHAVTGAGTWLEIMATRFGAGVFEVALKRQGAPPIVIDRLHIALDGTATVVGTYDLGTLTSFDQCKLDGAGALHCFGWANNFQTDTINRYSTTEPPVVEYDETGQVVQLHISTLVTGP